MRTSISRLALGALALGLGCEREAPPVSASPLDIDVVVREVVDGSTLVEVYVAELERPCSCWADGWPAAGACASSSDVVGCSCDPPPGSCLSSVRAVAGAEVLAEARVDPDSLRHGSLQLHLAEREGASLIIDGCGSSAQVPLSGALPVAPTITHMACDDDRYAVAWTSAGSGDEVAIVLGLGLGGLTCRDAFDGLAVLPMCPGEAAELLGLWTLDQTAVETSLGTVRVWRAGSTWVDGADLPPG